MTRLRPIFVFSLPRSGSTLLQRILGANGAISTASEPWLLLPLLYAPNGRGMYAEYGHREYVRAMEDFFRNLPGGRADYREAVRHFAEHLYARASRKSSTYFLDKTPRYHLIVREVIETFPDAKFIFLWRHPLAIAASMMETWSAGRWNVYRFGPDLYTGLGNLLEVYRERRGTVCALRYEDLVADPEAQVGRVFAYLDLPYEVGSVGAFRDLALEGRMGDPTGTRSYDTVSTAPLNKWPGVMGNPLRRSWARRYVEWIGEARLGLMGYSAVDILSEIDRAPLSMRYIASDLARMSLGPIRQSLESVWPLSDRSHVGR